MFLVRDIRETRVYQDAVEEGYKIGQVLVITKMAGKLSVEEIADILDLDEETVRNAIATTEQADPSFTVVAPPG
jgi:predicted transposase YdaD